MVAVAKDGKLFKTALGMLSVQYNYTVPAVFELLLAYRYGTIPQWVASALEAAIFAGSILGMLTMGYLGDRIGRARAYAMTTGITAAGTLACGLTSFGPVNTVLVVLVATRFVVGVGIGGVYPLSGAENFEDGGGREGTRQAAWAMFWQAPGQVLPYIVGAALSFGPESTDPSYAMLCLHGIILLGAVPAIVTMPNALGQTDSAEFQKRNESEAVQNVSDSCSVITDKRFRWKLLGTCGSWACFNVMSYGIGLYSPTILQKIFSGDDDFRSEMYQNILCCLVCIPSVLATIFLLNDYEPRTLQLAGFSIQACCFAYLGFLWWRGVPDLTFLFVVYVFTRAALYFGPTETVYLLPNEVFPTAVRSTCNGISAAGGKIGAIIGCFFIPSIEPVVGMSVVFAICALVAVTGVVLTLTCIPEDTLASGSSDSPEPTEASALLIVNPEKDEKKEEAVTVVESC